jgi:hypothetical protein
MCPTHSPWEGGLAQTGSTLRCGTAWRQGMQGPAARSAVAHGAGCATQPGQRDRRDRPPAPQAGAGLGWQTAAALHPCGVPWLQARVASRTGMASSRAAGGAWVEEPGLSWPGPRRAGCPGGTRRGGRGVAGRGPCGGVPHHPAPGRGGQVRRGGSLPRRGGMVRRDVVGRRAARGVTAEPGARAGAQPGTGADAQQPALVPRSGHWARLTAGVGLRWKDEGRHETEGDDHVV